MSEQAITAGTAETHGHPTRLQHHFDTAEQQFDAAKFGIWLFMATEILMFGGLFCAYAVYRANHPEIFIYAHQFLNKTLGGINTIVLIASSFTMAMAVRYAQLGERKLTALMLTLTLLGGFGFLGIKYVEYHNKFEEGLLWGKRYTHSESAEHGGASAAKPAAEAVAAAAVPPPVAPTFSTDPADKPLIAPPATGPAGMKPLAASEVSAIEAVPRNVQIFFGIYFAMTGLHAIHVLVGMGLIIYLIRTTLRGDYSAEWYTPVDLGGIYWHLVDLIWIFLFPLLYLIK